MHLDQELLYRPKTRQTQSVYEQVVHLVQRLLGDVSTEAVLDCTDELIGLLKDEEMPLSRRRESLEKYLGLTSLKDDEFHSLVTLVGQLTDFEKVDPVNQ